MDIFSDLYATIQQMGQGLFSLLESHSGGLTIPDCFSLYMGILMMPGPWQLTVCFIAASLLMITRLNAVKKNGFEGTIVETLVMPYFSGFPNLCFAYRMATAGNHASNGHTVLENRLANNVTNLTPVLALPAFLGRPSRWAGAVLNGLYRFFIYKGFIR